MTPFPSPAQLTTSLPIPIHFVTAEFFLYPEMIDPMCLFFANKTLLDNFDKHVPVGPRFSPVFLSNHRSYLFLVQFSVNYPLLLVYFITEGANGYVASGY